MYRIEQQGHFYYLIIELPGTAPQKHKLSAEDHRRLVETSATTWTMRCSSSGPGEVT